MTYVYFSEELNKTQMIVTWQRRCHERDPLDHVWISTVGNSALSSLSYKFRLCDVSQPVNSYHIMI